MTTGRRSLWTIGKLTLLAVVIAAAAFALAREGRPAHASHTQIFVAKSSACLLGDELTSYVTFVGGPAENLYLCVKDIDNDPWGAAGFNLDFKYVSWLLAVNSVLIDDPDRVDPDHVVDTQVSADS